MVKTNKEPRPAFIRRFDPRFLVNWTMSGVYGPNGLPVAYPTAKDAAVALALVGEFTKLEINFKAQNHVEVEQLARFGFIRDGMIDAVVKVSCAELRRIGQFDRQKLLDSSIERVACSKVCGKKLIDIENVLKVEGGFVTAAVDGKIATDAHPDKAKVSEAKVDMLTVGSFACRHSLPIYLRALTWLNHGFRKDTPECVVEDWKDGSVRADIAYDSIPDALGLDVEDIKSDFIIRGFTGIAKDFNKASLGISFKWAEAYNHRHARLRVIVSPLTEKDEADVPAAAMEPTVEPEVAPMVLEPPKVVQPVEPATAPEPASTPSTRVAEPVEVNVYDPALHALSRMPLDDDDDEGYDIGEGPPRGDVFEW